MSYYLIKNKVNFQQNKDGYWVMVAWIADSSISPRKYILADDIFYDEKYTSKGQVERRLFEEVVTGNIRYSQGNYKYLNWTNKNRITLTKYQEDMLQAMAEYEVLQGNINADEYLYKARMAYMYHNWKKKIKEA